MDKVNLLIKGGKAYVNQEFVEANIAIQDEKIHSITDLEAPLPPADRTIDAKGMHVLPA